MKLIKLGLISIVVLFGIMTAIASLLPSSIRVSRAIDIDAPRKEVVTKIADQKLWDRWNQLADSGNIRVTIEQITDSSVLTAWHPPSGRKFEGVFAVIESGSDKSIVQWYFDFKLRWYPWEKFQGIIYDQQLGPSMEKSLGELRKLITQ